MIRTDEEEFLALTLTKLSQEVSSRLSQAEALETLPDDLETLCRKNVFSFRKSDGGLSHFGYTKEERQRPSSFRIMLHLLRELEDWPTAQEAIGSMRKLNSSWEAPEKSIQRFAERFLYSLLDNSTKKNLRRKNLISALITNLRGRNSQLILRSRMLGLTVGSRPISIRCSDARIQIRQVTISDIEEEVSDFTFENQSRTDPTAMMYVTIDDALGPKGQIIFAKVLTGLRLFCVSSTQAIWTFFESDSFLPMGGGFGTGSMDTLRAHFGYHLAIDDRRRLSRFWQQTYPFLPDNHEQKFDRSELQIAKGRYEDALFSGGAGTERRIADAVMGLESLWLRDDEKEVLGYRLRHRVEAIAESFRQPNGLMRRLISDAYDVRSSFVHGSRVKEKTEEGLIKRHGGLEKLLYGTLEILRCSFVIFMLTQSKDQFIKLVDDSFTSSTKRKELTAYLNPFKTMIGLSLQPQEQLPSSEIVLPLTKTVEK